MSKKKLGDYLVEAGIIDRFQLQSALGHQRQWGGKIGRILVENRFVTEVVMVRALGELLHIAPIDLSTVTIHPKVIELVAVEFAEQHGIIPVAVKRGRGGDQLVVAMSDPTNLEIVDELQFKTGKKVTTMIAGDFAIETAIRQYYYGEIPRKKMEVSEDQVQFGGQNVSFTNPGVTPKAPPGLSTASAGYPAPAASAPVAAHGQVANTADPFAPQMAPENASQIPAHNELDDIPVITGTPQQPAGPAVGEQSVDWFLPDQNGPASSPAVISPPVASPPVSMPAVTAAPPPAAGPFGTPNSFLGADDISTDLPDSGPALPQTQPPQIRSQQVSGATLTENPLDEWWNSSSQSGKQKPVSDVVTPPQPAEIVAPPASEPAFVAADQYPAAQPSVIAAPPAAEPAFAPAEQAAAAQPSVIAAPPAAEPAFAPAEQVAAAQPSEGVAPPASEPGFVAAGPAAVAQPSAIVAPPASEPAFTSAEQVASVQPSEIVAPPVAESAVVSGDVLQDKSTPLEAEAPSKKIVSHGAGTPLDQISDWGALAQESSDSGKAPALVTGDVLQQPFVASAVQELGRADAVEFDLDVDMDDGGPLEIDDGSEQNASSERDRALAASGISVESAQPETAPAAVPSQDYPVRSSHVVNFADLDMQPADAVAMNSPEAPKLSFQAQDLKADSSQAATSKLDLDDIPLMDLEPVQAPVEVEAAPVQMEAAPVEVEAAPVQMEAAPVEVEAAPVQMEAAPVEVEAAPVQMEAAPVEVEGAPVQMEASAGPEFELDLGLDDLDLGSAEILQDPLEKVSIETLLQNAEPSRLIKLVQGIINAGLLSEERIRQLLTASIDSEN